VRERPAIAGVAGRILAAAAGLAATASAPLPGGWPPIFDLSEVVRWWKTVGPVAGLYGAARLVVVAGLAGWVALVALVGLFGATRWGARAGARAVALGQRVGAGGLVRLALGVSAGASLASGCGTGKTASSAADLPPPVLSAPARPDLPPPVLSAPARPDLPPPALSAPAPTGGPARLSAPARPDLPPPVLSAPAPTGGPARPAGPAQRARTSPPAPAPSPLAAPSLQGEPVTYIVRPGDDFWSIAAARTGAAPGSTARYWLALIAANRARLPVPGDPNLLFPGDHLVLPPVPPEA
jgi:hypothetical protein